ncbi:hypothetical protein PXK58_01995 [Phaeobacter gallaeciensis]|uniref:hypothetical protein n=1 Tax=Phaeobacter gallaeciensis TaxID=60890 RepID=UPI0023808226|nr:hypothetical protein [Phaeobacter gallaeciensis]MDE4272738.1 hypothetical protein [Phaeobacter gallaeciensis]MDE4298309.1 hypothetical protein [Phaeobacter gallaeciensis]MDE5183497.1 hypothetical protein [Phaeobacter gallaeciensis]
MKKESSKRMNDQDIGSRPLARSPGALRNHGRAGPFLTIIQCISTRRLEFYCGNVFLIAVVPSEPGSIHEVAEIYTVVLIELFKFLEQGSNHQRMAILEGVKKQPDLSSPPTGLGLLADSASTIGKFRQHSAEGDK